MKKPLKTLPANTIGKDYVIGDLHGSYSAFENLLKNINFDKAVDRMISVGDLIDRGPDSIACMDLIREPWFYAVLANHERMMLDKFFGGYAGNYWFANGGDWGIEAFNDYNATYNVQHRERIPSDHSMHIIDMLPLVDELPFLITVNMPAGKKYHIIHAELPSSIGKITDNMLADPEKVLSLATIRRGDGSAFLWSRQVFDSLYEANLENKRKLIRGLAFARTDVYNTDLSHIISGHTILQNPVTVSGQTNIDTGAYKSYWTPVDPYGPGTITPPGWAGLTCLDLTNWKFYKATSTKFTEVHPLVITEDDLHGWQ